MLMAPPSTRLIAPSAPLAEPESLLHVPSERFEHTIPRSVEHRFHP